MNLGKPIKVVEIPNPDVAARTEAGAPEEGGLIPLPRDWPRRAPARVTEAPTEPARREQARHG